MCKEDRRTLGPVGDVEVHADVLAGGGIGGEEAWEAPGPLLSCGAVAVVSMTRADRNVQQRTRCM